MKKKYAFIFFLITIFIIYFGYRLGISRDYLYIESKLKELVKPIYNIMKPNITVDYKNNTLTLTDEELKELSDLKELLNLNNTGMYTLENAIVTSRNLDKYFRNITVDKGSINGIKEGMIVINENGLVGIIEKTTEGTSLIKLLSSNEINVSVSLGNDTNAIINGYDKYLNGVIISGTDENLLNLEVTTNGLGKVIPKGIKVGKVINVKNDNNIKYIDIESYVDFNNIKYVSIIKGNK